MKSQQGSITLYAMLGMGAVILVMGVLLKIANYRAEKWENAHKTFVAQTEAIGKLAAEKARAKEKSDLATKQKVDNENKSLRASLAAESQRLRDARAGSSFLPRAPSGTSGTTVTADRAKLEAALRDFDSAASRLIDQGDSAIADLNSGKAWVKEQAAVKP
jgi:hypothetical protein